MTKKKKVAKKTTKKKVAKKATKEKSGKINQWYPEDVSDIVGRSKNPYLTITKIITHEEWFEIIDQNLSGANTVKAGLRDGDLNIIQHATIESHMWVVDANGRRIARLIKDGGMGPEEKVKIE